MIVQVLVEFEVTSEDGLLDERYAKEAAENASYNNLVLTKTGASIVDGVLVQVDGYGECGVRLPE